MYVGECSEEKAVRTATTFETLDSFPNRRDLKLETETRFKTRRATIDVVSWEAVGNQRDERLNRMWQQKKVKFLRPDVAEGEARRAGEFEKYSFNRTVPGRIETRLFRTTKSLSLFLSDDDDRFRPLSCFEGDGVCALGISERGARARCDSRNGGKRKPKKTQV